MTDHADTIRRAEAYIASEATNMDDSYAVAASIMRALLAERQQAQERIKELEEVRDHWIDSARFAEEQMDKAVAERQQAQEQIERICERWEKDAQLLRDQRRQAQEMKQLWHQKCDEALDRASEAMAKRDEADKQRQQAQEERDAAQNTVADQQGRIASLVQDNAHLDDQLQQAQEEAEKWRRAYYALQDASLLELRHSRERERHERERDRDDQEERQETRD